jgi:HlyD family secretion protein
MKSLFKKVKKPEASADTGMPADAVMTEDKAPLTKGAAVKKFFKKIIPKSKKVWILLLIVIIIIAGALVFLHKHQSSSEASNGGYVTDTVQYRDINSSITGSGTLAAANQYSVKSLVSGTILSDTFQEGDTVAQDTVLYNIDSSDSTNSLEQAELSLEKAQRSYSKAVSDQSDLTVTSPSSGQLISYEVEVGDDVKAGDVLATVRDSSSMTLKVNFPADDAAKISTGQTATVTMDSTFEKLTGTVTNVSKANTVLDGNLIVREVTINVKNPGGISTSQTATAAVGSATSTSSGSFEYKTEKKVTAETNGTVSKRYVSEGSNVSAGQTIIQLSSDDQSDTIKNAQDEVKNAELQLSDANKKLDDYTITSPIQGTVVDKKVKAGEKIEANTELCTIYDLSYLEMTLNVDELDIANIEVGQSVTITADAVEDKTYQGLVTKVSVAGTTTGSATTYPVTIQIDETDGLLPGMNVDAEISLESASHVLTIPAAALQRGNTVLVPDDGSSDSADTSSKSDKSSKKPADGEKSDSSDTAAAAAGGTESGGASTGGKYKSVQVETGISDGTYVQIISGLDEGDTIAYLPASTGSDDMFAMMGGDMPEGGMPSGGGDMPSGGGGGAPGGGGPMG